MGRSSSAPSAQSFVNGALPLFTDLAFYVAKPQKQHSGNDQCIMRYFFANAYQSLANSSNYYLSAAGTENVGTSLCTSAAGTGVNASKPQAAIPLRERRFRSRCMH